MTIAGVSAVTLLLVLIAGFGTGFIGYATGAASLVSYPSLLAIGVPPVLADTTNTVGMLGTDIGGLLSARKELSGHRARVIIYAVIGVIGGVAGALLLIELPPVVFEYLAPPLILFSAITIVADPGKRIANANATVPDRDDPRRDSWWMWLGVVFACVYNGYFGAGAGTLTIAVLGLGRVGSFHEINALKTVIGFGSNVTAAVLFIARGTVNWPYAIALGAGCFIGGALAPPVTRHIPANIMRMVAMVAGVLLAGVLGWSTYR
ncbi:permease [Bifidobacterium primatium]|uniref:Probable membrane transporter protein n=2 Tax=Bifidobacterium TaxID=1678 RepID=A0A2M9H8H6_9BIFI|nr:MULTISPECIES: sulfite exporter TauE/SafE family protein [Bifidobacterium]NEG96092.1 TSUP family transporter [Bifidobacterium sp. SMB2]NEH10830.1 TSUP family transporter [Bifidobacterium saimiriisciurei]PJM73108.1 permease [Bifidobacterium primatium]